MKEKIKNNINIYQDFDTNFEKAYTMNEAEFTHQELINMLSCGTIQEKQIAAIKLDNIYTDNEVNILLGNLTGCDGKIREAVAFKIKELLTANKEIRKIFAELSSDIFAKATIDINANICRLVIDSSYLLMPFEKFSIKYTNNIIQYINEALSELDKFIFRDKKYVINKQLFKLYWCLEAIIFFHEFADKSTLENLLNKCAAQKEYTIREKVAQILNRTNYPNISKMLANDDNYYVRSALKSS